MEFCYLSGILFVWVLLPDYGYFCGGMVLLPYLCRNMSNFAVQNFFCFIYIWWFFSAPILEKKTRHAPMPEVQRRHKVKDVLHLDLQFGPHLDQCQHLPVLLLHLDQCQPSTQWCNGQAPDRCVPGQKCVSAAFQKAKCQSFWTLGTRSEKPKRKTTTWPPWPWEKEWRVKKGAGSHCCVCVFSRGDWLEASLLAFKKTKNMDELML